MLANECKTQGTDTVREQLSAMGNTESDFDIYMKSLRRVERERYGKWSEQGVIAENHCKRKENV